ncbi:MAG: GNAT family N-acetyltransferase [Bacteroidales bacterium]|nr:GNAT family N-acetyltransferase [Bacteroidales bacterium]
MKQIIEPVQRELLEAELTEDKCLRETHYGSNKIYVVNYHNAPNVMREIGRLRELAFRNAGGGTGESIDIDEFDVHPTHPYEQIVVWHPESKQILGGYRYILCQNALNDKGSYDMATTELFHFSEKFKKEYLPHTLELGRSFVYQESTVGEFARKNIFVLDNLWEGIGAVLAQNPNIQYLFGKVTMYLSYDQLARDYILYFLNTYFKDDEKLVTTIKPLGYFHDERELAAVFQGKDLQEAYKTLFTKVRERKYNIPPLINSYINLSATMKTFGTSLNEGFGAVEETGILLTVADIADKKLERYVRSYRK